jgi:hypothetical protein
MTNNVNTLLLANAAAVDTTSYQFCGQELPDPMSMVLALPSEFKREVALRSWIRTEFNLPKSMRELCQQCFLRVLTHAQFAVALAGGGAGSIRLGERVYRLHSQSSAEVLVTAPLIGVSFRSFEGEAFAVAHVWAAKQTTGKGF